MIKEERGHKDTKVQGREIMMQVGDSTHDEEGDVMQEPAKEECLSNKYKLLSVF